MSEGGSRSTAVGMPAPRTGLGIVRIAAFISLVWTAACLAIPADAQTLRVMNVGLGEGSVTGTGINCGADCNETFASATSATLTATETPGTGSTFVGWGGDCSGVMPTCTVSVSELSSVRAEFGLSTPIPPVTDFTPGGIATYLSANPSVNTPARFIAALPVDFRQNWILMVRSESLQTGIATSPRILLPSADSTRVFTIGVTEHSSYPGAHSNAIEYMQWDAGQNNFRFHEIVLDAIPAMGDIVDMGPPAVRRFPARSRSVSDDDPKCFACHSTRNVLNRETTPATDGIPPGSVGHKSKPNWDTYDSWAGMLSFNRDRIYQGSVEAAAFRRIFNLWTWQTNDTARSVIESLELQPPGVPAAHVITRNTGGGANDGHISFQFDGSAIVTREPAPVGTGADGSSNYEFDGTIGSGGASTFARDGTFITLHHSALPTCFGGGCSPGSDEGRGVDLFDELFGALNPQRVADEVVNHRFATGSIPFDVRPLALAVAQRCFAVAGGTDVSATQTITSTPALSPAALSALAFFDQRHGVSSFDQVYDDTRLRQAYLTLRKADIQRIALDRTIDPYAYDPNPSAPPPPPAIIDGLVQAFGGDTELFDSGAPLSAAELLERIRGEVFRRRPSASQGDSTLMDGIYVDREVIGTAPQMTLYRYFLEPLGVSVDKWSIAVRGRSRTYTMADVFMGIYDNALAGRLKPALGLAAGLGMTDTCNAVIPMVETSLAALPPTTGPGAMPTYTDIQRIFNKSCIECHGGLGYPPYHTYGTYLDLSEDENPPTGDRRMTRSWTIASSLAGTSPTSSFLVSRITDGGRLAHPYDPDEPYNRANPDDPADPDVLDERCPYGLMPCGGPPLSGVDIETIRRWVEGGASYSEGDPHIKTVDGVNYDLQTAGEFVLLRDEGLELQARHTPVTTAGPLAPNPYTELSTCVSINTAVAVRSGGQRISYQPSSRAPIDPDRRIPGGRQLVLRIDGVPTQPGQQPILLSSGGRIRQTSADGGIQIEHPGGTVIVITPAFWSHHQVWYMNINVRRARATAGIMGPIAPGNWLPALPDGTQLGPRPTGLPERYDQLYRTFADAWRVTNATSLFDYDPGLSADSYDVPRWPEFAPNNCTAPPVPDGSSAGSPAPMDLADAQALCRAVVAPDRQANCVADVAATGDAGFAEAYLVTERLELNQGPSEPLLGLPADFSENLVLPVHFTWTRAVDRERDGVTYRHCVWSTSELFDYNKCAPVIAPFAARDSLVYAGVALLLVLLLLLILFLTILRNRPVLLALVALLLLPAIVVAFYAGRGETLDETVTDLEPGGSYFWKVIAEDEEGAIAESVTRRLTVQ